MGAFRTHRRTRSLVSYRRRTRMRASILASSRTRITQHYGSHAARVDSRASFLPSITVPAPHGWIPAPHFCPALRFPRRTGGFPRPIFTQHYGSRAARVDSRAPFFCSITVPAPHGWVPAPHFYSALRFPRAAAIRRSAAARRRRGTPPRRAPHLLARSLEYNAREHCHTTGIRPRPTTPPRSSLYF